MTDSGPHEVGGGFVATTAINGVAIRKRGVGGGVYRWAVAGDLVLGDHDELRFEGARAASLLVGNNVRLAATPAASGRRSSPTASP